VAAASRSCGTIGPGGELDLGGYPAFLPRNLALRTRAEAAQIIEGVDARGMTVVPKDLQGVSSYQFCALRFQRFDAEHR
jgi:hypothetical protein